MTDNEVFSPKKNSSTYEQQTPFPSLVDTFKLLCKLYEYEGTTEFDGNLEDLEKRVHLHSTKKKSTVDTSAQQMVKTSKAKSTHSRNALEVLDETDLFYLSMSRMTKKLPKLEQTKIKVELSNSVLSAEMKYSEQPVSTIYPQHPFNQNPQQACSSSMSRTTTIRTDTRTLRIYQSTGRRNSFRRKSNTNIL